MTYACEEPAKQVEVLEVHSAVRSPAAFCSVYCSLCSQDASHSGAIRGTIPDHRRPVNAADAYLRSIGTIDLAPASHPRQSIAAINMLTRTQCTRGGAYAFGGQDDTAGGADHHARGGRRAGGLRRVDRQSGGNLSGAPESVTIVASLIQPPMPATIEVNDARDGPAPLRRGGQPAGRAAAQQRPAPPSPGHTTR